jgi:hypothetical protein
MKAVLIWALCLFVESAAYSQVDPNTNTPDGRIAAIAAKFCEMYSQDPRLESAFNFGSSAMEDYRKSGIEEIRIICLDGFVKTFWMMPETKRKIKNIDYLSRTKGVIHYTDGSESTTELFFCAGQPVYYLIIKKNK